MADDALSLVAGGVAGGGCVGATVATGLDAVAVGWGVAVGVGIAGTAVAAAVGLDCVFGAAVGTDVGVGVGAANAAVATPPDIDTASAADRIQVRIIWE